MPRGPFSYIEANPLHQPKRERVLRPGPGVCLICCGPTSAAFALCFACQTVARRLGRTLAAVLPVSLCPLPGPLYSVLMGYKESPVAEVRRRSARKVEELLTEFLTEHRWCVFTLLGGFVDVVLPVPSSSRPGPPPLNGVPGLSKNVVSVLEGASCGILSPWCPTVLQRALAPVGHLQPDRHAFEVPAWARPMVGGSRILLIDDTYVSGARAQSAASALRDAGAHRVLIVPVGRVIRPDRVAEHAVFLKKSRTSRARGHRCARCVVTQSSAGAATG